MITLQGTALYETFTLERSSHLCIQAVLKKTCNSALLHGWKFRHGRR